MDEQKKGFAEEHPEIVFGIGVATMAAISIASSIGYQKWVNRDLAKQIVKHLSANGVRVLQMHQVAPRF